MCSPSSNLHRTWVTRRAQRHHVDCSSSARAESICSYAYATIAAVVMCLLFRARESYVWSPSTLRRWAITVLMVGKEAAVSGLNPKPAMVAADS